MKLLEHSDGFYFLVCSITCCVNNYSKVRAKHVLADKLVIDIVD